MAGGTPEVAGVRALYLNMYGSADNFFATVKNIVNSNDFFFHLIRLGRSLKDFLVFSE